MNENQLEDILTEETRKIVGYTMPLLEAIQADPVTKQNFKKILWKFKDNLREKLIQEKDNDKSNKS